MSHYIEGINQQGDWIYLEVNPDPWAVGPLGVGRRNGKMYPYIGPNKQLQAYQDSIRAELASLGITSYDGEERTWRLRFWFWRQIESHSGGKKNYADATNLQKATEDAIQDVLIGNDRFVADIHSIIVEQSPTTKPGVLIYLEDWELFGHDQYEIPDVMLEKIAAPAVELKSDNSWL